jgi:hypothetical protein
MHQKSITYGLLAAFAALASAEDKSDVTQLTQATFDDFVKANDLVLAECKFTSASPLHGACCPSTTLVVPNSC